MNSEERFWARVEVVGACLLWRGRLDHHGYGRHAVGTKYVAAHRFAFESAQRPVPDGYELDHLCRTPACVNPEHLDVVSHRENMLRGETFAAEQARRTHCPQGHALAGSNLIRYRDHRQCRECTQARRRTPEMRAYMRAWLRRWRSAKRNGRFFAASEISQ